MSRRTTKRSTLIRYTELPEMDELYDLQADPWEMKNLIHDSRFDATRSEMNLELLRLLEETKEIVDLA